MRIFNILILFVLIGLFACCSGGKQISTTMQNGETAYQSGNYNDALQHFETVIAYYEQNDRSKECPVYAKAANTAKQLGLTEKAIGYLKQDQYSNFVNADTYYSLAGLYQEIDNLSKEMEELETYVSKYPDGDKIVEVHSCLFELYVESQNWTEAEKAWNNLPGEVKSTSVKLEEYFQVNEAIDNDSVCGLIAADLLKIDENNLPGLDWTAKKYFWKAENRYQDELKAYEKNKTNKQYNKLLKALDIVSADFKTSLDYFKKFYTIDPNPGTAKYLGNIYNRLDDKKKADYYYRIAKGND